MRWLMMVDKEDEVLDEIKWLIKMDDKMINNSTSIY